MVRRGRLGPLLSLSLRRRWELRRVSLGRSPPDSRKMAAPPDLRMKEGFLVSGHGKIRTLIVCRGPG